jgi:hypothetical protein
MSTREVALASHLVRECYATQLEAAAAAGVSQQAVSRLLQRASTLSDGGAGSAAAGTELLVTPQHDATRRSGGRPSLLTPDTIASIQQAFKEDPFGGVGEVRKALHEHGLDAPERSLYRWLSKLHLGARATNIYAALNERLIHGLLNHIEAVQAALEGGTLTHENIAYADQTPIYILAGHKSANGSSVVFGDGGDTKMGKKVGNLWAVITVQGCLRAWLTDDNGDEESTKAFYMTDTLPPGWINVFGEDGNIFDLVVAHGLQLRGRNRKMILCVDRLGKSGSSEYPVAGHHAPELRVRAQSACVGLLMLPPKGALVNPIELWNMHTKRLMNLAQPAGLPKDSWQQFIRGPRTKTEALEMLKQAIIDINNQPRLMRWCYHERATGKDALHRLADHAVAHAVRAARAAQPVAPFDLKEVAFAPRARMSAQHAYPPSACVKETYNVYFWRHHRLGLHAGLPAPFTRPIDKADGSERRCRLCKPNTNGARSRDTTVVCCDSCPGVYHYECLGLEAAPTGAWECDACVRGDVGALRVWKNPNAPPAGAPKPKVARKRKRAPVSDDERESSDAE